VTETPNVPKVIEEAVYTPAEIARLKKLHPGTIREMFLEEPGVIRLGRPATRRKRQYFTLRIPESVAERVFARLTVARRVTARKP
jgi:hypothetical protein